MRALVDFDVGQRVELRSDVIVFRDDQCPFYRHAEDVIRAYSHCRRCLADRGNPDGAGGSSQRPSNRAAPRHPVQARLKQLEKQTATGIGKIHKRYAPQVWGVNYPE